MEILANVVNEFVEWGKEAKKLGETWADRKSEKKIPDEKFVDGGFGNVTLFPSDFGVGEVGDDGSDGGGDEAGEP